MNPPDFDTALQAVGYTHPGYAESLKEFGVPRYLPGCRGWLLERKIPGTDLRDAIGCYPMFSCENWSRLPEDIAALSPDLITLSMVPEVFGEHDPGLLGKCFDKVVPFKQHFVADLIKPIDQIVSRHHRCRWCEPKTCPKQHRRFYVHMDAHQANELTTPDHFQHLCILSREMSSS